MGAKNGEFVAVETNDLLHGARRRASTIDSDDDSYGDDASTSSAAAASGVCRSGHCYHNRLEKGRMTKKARRAQTQLRLAAAFCFAFLIAEFVGGYLANSLAIMSDAAHLLSDLGGLFISMFALWLSSRGTSPTLSYGYHRAEIIGVIVSVVLIWTLTGFLVAEGIHRVQHPHDVSGRLMFIIAACGLVVNIAMAKILHQGGGHGHSHGGGGHGHSHGGGHGHSHGGGGHGKKNSAAQHNINVRAAFIHVIGDLVQSVGVMIAAVLIWIDPKYRIADPICTFVFSILVMITTVRLMVDSIRVLMESVPAHLDVAEIEADLLALDHVAEVHDMHVWSLSLGKPLFSAHVRTHSPNTEPLLRRIRALLATKYDLKHSTVQIEPYVHPFDNSDPEAAAAVAAAAVGRRPPPPSNGNGNGVGSHHTLHQHDRSTWHRATPTPADASTIEFTRTHTHHAVRSNGHHTHVFDADADAVMPNGASFSSSSSSSRAPLQHLRALVSATSNGGGRSHRGYTRVGVGESDAADDSGAEESEQRGLRAAPAHPHLVVGVGVDATHSLNSSSAAAAPRSLSSQYAPPRPAPSRDDSDSLQQHQQLVDIDVGDTVQTHEAWRK